MPNTKYAATIQGKDGQIYKCMDSEAREDISAIVTASANDVDKVLSPKTVSGGKVTEWQFVAHTLDQSTIISATEDWLDENVAQETGYVLDRTLQANNAAAPADVAGEIRKSIDDFFEANDLDENDGKVNLLSTPYDISDIDTGKQIYSNGTINEQTNRDISPLIPVTEGTYGLKTTAGQYVGYIDPGNSYKNGYGFFAADGETVVSRPSTLLHQISTWADGSTYYAIYVFDVPSDAKYVRFCYSSGEGYRDNALGYFNQWIMLPDADDNIDNSFFTLKHPKQDGETNKIVRADNTNIFLRDNRIGNMSNLNTSVKTDIVSAINESMQATTWLKGNDLDVPVGKINVLSTPYSISSIMTGQIIYSNGSINANTNTDVSPLIPVTEGTYGLKTTAGQYVGYINSGNTYRNGYGFFAADGETVVSRPSTLLHQISTWANGDTYYAIYVFDVPSDAKYVRFCYQSGDGYRDRALGYFNQWILLPDADDNIDNSFFAVQQPKQDGEMDRISRADNTKLYLRDNRIGDLSNLNTSSKTNIVSAINESLESGGGQAADWLEENGLDATVNGKVNILNTPYDISDVMTAKAIYANGTINDTTGCDVSPLIPISEGTYGLKTAYNQYIGTIMPGNDYKNGYGFFGADGTTVVSRPSNLLHEITTGIYVFDVPSDAKYVRFSYKSQDGYRDDALGYFNQWILLPNANDNIDASFFTLSTKKPNGQINKIMRVDGSYLTITDTQARSDIEELKALPITFGRRTCAIFEKVCCIGDSYTEGYIVDSSDVSHTNKAYSWVEHLKNMTGRDYVNLGIGGATSASWLTSQRGLAAAQLPANKAQAYIIGLQINDAAQGLTVGTTADIGTNAQTYYGCTSKVIDEMFTISNDAHVFLLTQPKNYTGEHTPYRTAILNIVAWYQDANNGTHQNQVHLIDLLDYWQLFRNAGCADAMYGGHYTPVGYEYVAELIMYAWSNYINAHPLTFQDVNLIPFGSGS